VVEERPYLWAALRQRLEPSTAYVLGASPLEVSAVWAVCDPWPWIVVGTTAAPVPGLAERLRGRPIPVHWLGAPPPGLPRSGSVHGDWLRLVDELAALGGRSVNGVRLLRNRGLRTADGRVVPDAANVEGLFAAPEGLPAVDETAIRAELAANHLPLGLAGDGALLRLVQPPTDRP
jgi:hypothetical protein